MAGILRSGAVCGSLLLVAATGWMAWGEDRPPPRWEAAVDDQPLLVAPASSPMPVASVPEERFAPMGRPQYRTCSPGRFGRFVDRCRAKFWGYPEEFCEPPLGAMVTAHYVAQTASGQAARMGFYQYDFLPDSVRLNARGKSQLARLVRWLPTNDCPVFVEPTQANPELDELRREAVWRELSGHQPSIPTERVIVGRPGVRGLDAGDALAVDRNRRGLTAARGLSTGGGEASTTSTSDGGDTGSEFPEN